MKKLLLMVFITTLGLFFTNDSFAQKSKRVKVANNNELIKALANPNVTSFEITQDGFYDKLLLNATSGTIVVKGGNGSRANCSYYITPSDSCFDANPKGNIAVVGTINPGGATCPSDNTGVWSVVSSPGGSTINLLSATNMYVMNFNVDMAGAYKLRYTWPAPFNTHVETEYFFYDVPEITDLHATPDTVCGLTTQITFDYNMGFSSPDTTVNWYVNSADSTGVYDSIPGTFTFTAPSCGAYTLQLHVENSLGCGGSDSTIYLYFYDEPVVTAGINDSVCGLSSYLYPSYTGALCDAGVTPVATWSQISGPGTATFTSISGTQDSVHVTDCGSYTFQYKVVNGQCSDSATVVAYYYDTPTVNAGTDDEQCGLIYTLSPSYAVSCTNGVSVDTVWSVLNVTSGHSATFVGNVVTASDCGTYDFVYTVTNGLCESSDTVQVKFYDTPVVHAGMDMEVCGTSDSLKGYYNLTCANGTATTVAWSQYDGPTGGVATFTSATMDTTGVSVDSCGTYQFIYTVTNGPCTQTDTVTYKFYDTPVVSAGADDTLCSRDATLDGSYTASCTNGGTPTTTWTKVSGPGVVNYVGGDTTVNPLSINVDTCGVYVFEYAVTNGPACTGTDQLTLTFYDTPTITETHTDSVCGFNSTIYASYSTGCYATGNGATMTSTNTNVDSIVYNAPSGSYTAYVNTCGVYDFVYSVTNGPCSVDSTITLTFFETPDPRIVGSDTVYTCSTTNYTVEDTTCNTFASYTFYWSVSGGAFSNGLTADTGTVVSVTWDNDYSVTGTLMVHSTIIGSCQGYDTLSVVKLMPTLEGQVKYWNTFETYMPTPFPTNIYGTFPEDYFYVTLYKNGLTSSDSVATAIVQPRLMEDLTELMSYFKFDIDTYLGACDDNYFLKIWDGGLSYHNAPAPPPVSGTYLGASYTYTNWSGVNATDALAIQLMVGGATQLNDPTTYNYYWVGDKTATPYYGYYSHGVADVNSTNTYTSGGITALDALTAKYRAVGLLGSYPDNGSSNLFTPNFRVTGRMVDSLPQITFLTGGNAPFDYTNVNDVPFTHSGSDYQYFSGAIDHKYTADTLPWEGKKNYINIYYEAIGDVNASYVPTSGGFKAEPNMELTYEGLANTHIDSEMTIPVSIDQDAELGAITLSFTYRNDLIEVLGTNYSDDDMFINQEEGILNIAWFSTDGIDMSADATIAQIRVRVLAEIPEGIELFQLNANTELADVTANPIFGINLKTIGVTTEKGINNNTELTSTNYPNPFKNATTISYVLPESGKVKVDVYNNMGVLVKTLVDEMQVSGVQNVIFDSKVEPGVYMYNITVKGESNNYSTVKRMIVVN